MKTIAKTLLVLAIFGTAASASAEPYKSVFEQRRDYLRQQEHSAWTSYQATKSADEQRINSHYVRTGQWLNASPSVESARDRWSKLYNTPKP
jgi:hypothetical protein